jgi:hypothetical protein
MRGLGRGLLLVAVLLLGATAALHASGCGMVAGWTADLPRQQSQGLQLVWLTDSLSWIVAAVAWIIASVRPNRSWQLISLLLASIPLLTGAGILFIEPSFFGGYLLIGSGTLAGAGAGLRLAKEKS